MSQSALTSTLIIITVCLGFSTTFAVDSIDRLTLKIVVTQDFIGLILLPLLGCNSHSIILAAEEEMLSSFAITLIATYNYC